MINLLYDECVYKKGLGVRDVAFLKFYAFFEWI